MPNLPNTVSTADFAALVGRTPRRIQQLVSGGNLPSAGHGRMALAESIRAYANWRVESEIRALRSEAARQKRNGDGGNHLDAERTRKLRLENDETERQLIRTEDAVAAIDAIVGQIPADLSAVAARVTDDIALRRKIEDAIDDALNDLSRRFRQATADLEAGRDALGQDAEDEPDDMGANE